MPEDPRAPYFVLAHHRSGSNFLNDLLQSHPSIECVNEPLSMHTSFFRQCDLEIWRAEDFDATELHPSLAYHQDVRHYLVTLRAYLNRSSSRRVIGFKETVLFGKLDWLRAYLPGLKVLFLKRDPRAIVSSVLRSGLYDFWKYATLVPPVFERLFPQHVGSRSNDPAVRAAEVAAMSVMARYELARRSIGAFEHLELRLDDLLREPQERLDAMAAFLGIERRDEPVAFLKSRQAVTRGGPFSSFRTSADAEAAWRRHLDAQQLRAIEEVLQCR